MLKRSHPRRNIASFTRILSPKNRSELKQFVIIALKVLKNFHSAVEPFASYGSEFVLPNDRFRTQKSVSTFVFRRTYMRSSH